MIRAFVFFLIMMPPFFCYSDMTSVVINVNAIVTRESCNIDISDGGTVDFGNLSKTNMLNNPTSSFFLDFSCFMINSSYKGLRIRFEPLISGGVSKGDLLTVYNDNEEIINDFSLQLRTYSSNIIPLYNNIIPFNKYLPDILFSSFLDTGGGPGMQIYVYIMSNSASLKHIGKWHSAVKFEVEYF